MERFHPGATKLNVNAETSSESDFSCSICSKTLQSKKNLETHITKVHKEVSASGDTTDQDK